MSFLRNIIGQQRQSSMDNASISSAEVEPVEIAVSQVEVSMKIFSTEANMSNFGADYCLCLWCQLVLRLVRVGTPCGKLSRGLKRTKETGERTT